MSGNYKDLTGKIFGRLTVIERTAKPEGSNRKESYWLCECECGNKIITVAYNLNSGHTASCGCLAKEKRRNGSKAKDLTNKRFGKIIAIKRVESPTEGRRRGAYWLCKCDCGNEKIIMGGALLNGSTKSCGCLRAEKSKLSNHMVDISGNRYGKLVVVEFYEKTEDKDTLWRCLCDCGNEKIVKRSLLQSEQCKSCGCLYEDIIQEKSKNYYGIASFKRLYRSYRRQAESRKLIFNLAEDYFFDITKQDCYFCGIEPKQTIKGKNGDYIYNGVDRLNPQLGYILGNVVPCCGKCNRAKMSETHDDFLDWINKVYFNRMIANELYIMDYSI